MLPGFLHFPVTLHGLQQTGIFRNGERAYIARKELPVWYDYADRDSYFFMKRLDRKTRQPWKSPPDQFP